MIYWKISKNQQKSSFNVCVKKNTDIWDKIYIHYSEEDYKIYSDLDQLLVNQQVAWWEACNDKMAH